VRTAERKTAIERFGRYVSSREFATCREPKEGSTMTAKTTILAMAFGLILALGIGNTAEARTPRGAFIVNTNSIDPTHKHNFDKFGTRRQNPNDPQCCGTIPRINYLQCGDCDRELRFDPNGRLDRTRTYPVPVR